MTTSEPRRPRPNRPTPINATSLAYSRDFIRAVSVAIMSVALEGPPEAGQLGTNLVRLVVSEPEVQAARFAIAVATDPAIVTASASPEGVTLEALVTKVREVWPILAGDKLRATDVG